MQTELNRLQTSGGNIATLQATLNQYRQQLTVYENQRNGFNADISTNNEKIRDYQAQILNIRTQEVVQARATLT